MNYDEAISYILSRRKFQKSSGNERIFALMEALSNPQKELKFIHIVGTNGKGTVSTELSYILKSAGYKTGLFTSPYVTEFGERIQVNNQYIGKDILSEIVSDIKNKVDVLEKSDIYPTVFEVTTAIALVYFKMVGCDIVVLEAGIGGEHDSTNIIPPPLVSVIMSVSLDHTEMLGNTIAKITEEKCGIIKRGCAVVSYPDNCKNGLSFVAQSEEAINIIKSRCEKIGCPLIIPESKNVNLLSDNIDGSIFSYDKLKIELPFVGNHQIANAITAIETSIALRSYGFNISDKDIEHGIKSSFIPARMEKISDKPMIILDGGHNVGCMTALSDMIKKYLQNKKIIMLMAFMKDKDYEKAIKIIAPLCDTMIFTRTDTLRGEKVEELKKSAERYCEKVYTDENPLEAFLYAKKLTDENSCLIVAGSFYLAGEIRNNFYR